VGPFLAAILAYVATTAESGRPWAAGLQGGVTLFSFGLGLGIPFLVLAIFSGKVMSIPRAGPWMDKIKSFFGLVMIGVAIYFLSLIQGFPEILSAILFGVLTVIMGVFLGPFRRSEAEDSWLTVLVKSGGILLLLLGAYLFVGAIARMGVIHPPLASVGGSEARKLWVMPTTLEEFDRTLESAVESGKPVVVDFWATYCQPCKIMDKTVFRDPEVLAAMGRFVAIKVDTTDNSNPLTKMRFERYKAQNLPFLTFYDSRGNHLPEKSVGKVDKEEFLEILSTIE
jgi:thiol:disulfide interchange protein DsbD